MKNLFALTILAFFINNSANAKPDQCLPPKKLVEELYKKFSPVESNGKNISSQNTDILKKYFSKNLTSLIDKDNKCEIKTGGICKINYDILTNSQDIDDDTKIVFLKTQKFDDVVNMISFNSSNKFIRFNFIKEKSCYLIDDIIYDRNTSLKKALR